jgi:hypothetical protein
MAFLILFFLGIPFRSVPNVGMGYSDFQDAWCIVFLVAKGIRSSYYSICFYTIQFHSFFQHMRSSAVHILFIFC